MGVLGWLLNLGFGGGTSAVESRYVDMATGDDTTGDGTTENKWKTIGKAIATLTGSNTYNVYVTAGNYYEEGDFICFVNGNGVDITFIPVGGHVVIRLEETATYTTRAWLTTGSGTYRFHGDSGYKFKFDCELKGDGSAMTTGYYLIQTASGVSWYFQDCELWGHGTNGSRVIGGDGGGVYDLHLKRCYIHDFAAYVFTTKGGTFEMEACFVENVTDARWFFGDMTSTTIKNNTFRSAAINQYTTETHVTLTLQNNIIVWTHASNPMVQFNAVTNLTCSGNVVYRTITPPTPVSDHSSYYTGILFQDNHDFVDTSLFLDPGFENSTGPELADTSLLIGRGVNAGVTTPYSGADEFDNTNLPTPGCWAPTDGLTKNNPTRTNGKVGIFGDSFTWGTNASNAAHRYTNLIEAALPTVTFLKMPGNTDYHMGLYGKNLAIITHMIHAHIQTQALHAVLVLCGVNDLIEVTPASNAALIQAFSDTLDQIDDFGVEVIYGGTQIKDADETSPDTADSIAVELGVYTHAIAQGYQAVRTSYEFMQVANWNDDTLGFYAADDLHPNDSGHAYLAELLAPSVTAATTSGGPFPHYTRRSMSGGMVTMGAC